MENQSQADRDLSFTDDLSKAEAFDWSQYEINIADFKVKPELLDLVKAGLGSVFMDLNRKLYVKVGEQLRNALTGDKEAVPLGLSAVIVRFPRENIATLKSWVK